MSSNSKNNNEYNNLNDIAIDGEDIENADAVSLYTGRETIAAPHSAALTVEGIPNKVYAGADVPITVSIKCDNGCNFDGDNISGSIVRIFGSENEELCSAAINSVEGDGAVTAADNSSSYNNIAAIAKGSANELTATFTLNAPKEPGNYTWRAELQACEGFLHNCGGTEFSFSVREHEIILSAWGTPSPTNMGEEFTAKIGARCTAGCSLAGLPIVIRDEEGQLIANGNLGDDILPNTAGTYWAAQPLTAPGDEGVYTWFVHCDNMELELAHKIETAEFTFRTVAPPEYNVTVNVLKKYDGVKIDGANVMLGFRKGITNEYGSVALQASGGEQMLRASKIDYVPYSEPHVIDGDCEINIELEFNPAT